MARDFNRRDFVKGVGAASVVGMTGIAGCIGDEDEPIPIGSILPLTGPLEDFGPAMQDAMELAVDEVNDAGGPLGREIDWIPRDSETLPSAGVDRYEDLVTEHDIAAFVGAASSGVSAPIAENVADDQVMMISPASTSPIFVDIGWRDDLKYFGRTAPNDGQQGVVMAWIMNEVLEAETAGFLFVDNPYGEGLADVTREHFEGDDVAFVGYDEEDVDFTSTLDSLFADDPEVVAFVGYTGEGRPIMEQWNEGGYGGHWVLSEGLHAEAFLTDLSDLLEGFHITTPDPEETAGLQHFADAFPGEVQGVFEAHTYDAMYLIALAMHQGGEATGTAVAENVLDIATAPGEEVTAGELERAFELIDDGEDINYIGASSPLEMNENIEALNPFAAQEIVEGGAVETIERFPVEYFEGML